MATARRLVKLFLSIFLFWFDYLLDRLLAVLGKQGKGPAVVLYYHSVKPNERERFARQMDDLLKRAKAVPLETCSQSRNGSRRVAITFDDGFTNFVENALPELERRNIPAAIFVPSGLLGGKASWISDIRNRDFNEDVISAGTLKQLANNALITIGSHCITHPDLLSLTAKQAEAEIFQSKKDLENILEREVGFLSFPHGSFDTVHVELARRSGYKRVFSIMPDFSPNPSSYIIGRVKAGPSDWSIEFRLKIQGAYRWLPIASAAKSKLKALRG